MSENQPVKIVFPESESEDHGEVKSAFNRLLIRGHERSHIFTIDEISRWFSTLEVRQVELWLETAVKAGDVVHVFVAPEGRGGIRMVLAPKEA